MARPPKPPNELLEICNRWSNSMEKLSHDAARIEYFQGEMPAFLLTRSVFIDILKNITKGSRFPDLRQAQIFENELLLYLNSKRLFSLRMSIFARGDYTPIHDHNSWGVSGSVVGHLGVVRYAREDDGSVEGYARLRQTAHLTLQPGETEITLALNEGIHQTGNPTEDVNIMVSVYGNPIRRLYINRFDLEHNKVYKLYPPRIKKKMLASQALKYFNT